ncbi:MAG TPA: Lrp/AsnC ligand binding domain-containing protein, partial [Micromonosporaceae bacterium]|nr:Lrp/AsnC ligand binding domain-containing protein [Micromonosporaceae bacterium]HET8682124.1 Lrp/AsnC ligand binding domain-containing protein [Micromonosporaceae bacterium]
MVQAYILIQTEVGKARDVAAAIRDISGVVRVDAVTGPYDVVVLTEARSVDELGKMIVSKVQL